MIDSGKITNSVGQRASIAGHRVMIGLLLLVLALGTGSCGEPMQQAILGAWEQADNGQRMEFQADGTLVVYEPSGEVRTGTYTFADPTHVVLNLPGYSRTFEVDIRFNQMMLTSSTGTGAQSGIFLRVR